MSKFVVILNNASTAQLDTVTAYFRTKPWGFWHHFDNIWLLAGLPDDITAQALAVELVALPGIGSHSKMVIKLHGDAPYWGNGPKGGWEWMRKFWGKPSAP